jgi:phosphoenolpyruvate-protein kinase (PTS system EI component)
MELARHHNKQNTKEERELQRVLSASEEELKRIEEEEKERFDQAVALSNRGELLERRDDERLIQNAIAESQQEEMLAREALVVHEQELEQDFQDALASSLADAAADVTGRREQDEEELEQAFQDTLTRSLADAAAGAGDTDPREQDEEERMMQLALKLSMQ